MSATDGDTCPLCLEALPAQDLHGTATHRSLCCGQLFCCHCARDYLSGRAQALDGDVADEMALLERLRGAGAPAEQIEERTRRARDLLRDIARAQTCPLCRAPFPKTEEECAALCQRHADRNAAWAQHSMAVRYEEGRAVPRDYARAVELFGLAAAQGYALSQFALGQIYVHGRYGIAMDVREGLRLLEAAVAQDDAKAMWVLATVYRDGKPGVPTDLPLAVRLIRQSAELGLDSAQSELGYMCEHGWGVAESLPEALRWYKAAAEQGNATAQLSMGGCLMRVSQERFGRADATGHSVVPQALRWARMAAAQGCSEANRFIEQLESQFRRQCHNCGKQPGKGCCVLSVCVRCRSVWYCGKDCQRAHWRAGHKRDCVKSSSSNDHQPHLRKRQQQQ